MSNERKEIEMKIVADGPYLMNIDINTFGRVELGEDYAHAVSEGLKDFLQASSNTEVAIEDALKSKSEANASEEANEKSTCMDDMAKKILNDLDSSSELEMEKMKNTCLEGMLREVKSDMKQIVTTGLTLEIQDRWRLNIKMEEEMDSLLVNGSPEEIAEGFINHLKEVSDKIKDK